jgi:hypothetical protein
MSFAENIKQIINEELSISLNVEKVSLKIRDAILDKCTNIVSQCYNNVKYKEGHITYNIFDIDYDIHFKVYTNIDDTYSEKLYGCIYISEHRMDLNLCKINGISFAPKFENIIFHEVEHIYQYSLHKRDYLSDIKTLKLYNKILEIINIHNNENDLIIANALFMSFEFEQDAMVHGLYGTLMNTNKEYLYDTYLHTDEHAFLEDMNYVLEHKDELDYTIFNISKNKIISLIKNQYKRYLNKLMHVYQLVYNKKFYSGI